MLHSCGQSFGLYIYMLKLSPFFTTFEGTSKAISSFAMFGPRTALLRPLFLIISKKLTHHVQAFIYVKFDVGFL